MCGIVGFVGNAKREGKVFQNVIEKSVTLLKHRGTDDTGIFTAKNYGLGFCRLAIYKRIGLKKLLFEFKNKEDKFYGSKAGLLWNLLNLEVWIRMFVEDKKIIT
tara:strand:+ start:403 stop:714 length:312 start_codon:yes stop_codon:yes gene_type:complete